MMNAPEFSVEVRSCARSGRRYSAASISFLTRRAWLPISRP